MKRVVLSKAKTPLLLFVLLIAMTQCAFNDTAKYTHLLEPGVSKTLAEYRKENYRLTTYNLEFSIPESLQEKVTGHVDIFLSVADTTPIIIDFWTDESNILSVKLNDKEVKYQFVNEHLFIAPTSGNTGEAKVSVGFIVKDQSLNRREEFLYTLLVPERARTLFPCFDQPDMKASYKLALEVPAGWKAVGNSAASLTQELPDKSRRRIEFYHTEALSTYLFSFVAGILEEEAFERNGRPLTIYHRETDPAKVAQCPDIANEVFDALEWLESYTAMPYPFSKYDLIILPGFQYSGMEHTGATLYTERRLFLNPLPTINERLSRSALIAHETAHMWFGDLVTMKWFDDVWTKEVFANYFAAKMVEPLYPEIDHRLNFIRSYYPAAYSEDRTAGTTSIRQDLGNLQDAGLVYGQIIYNKSPIVMEMLVKKIGDDAFRDGIREYVRKYSYSNATWDDLIEILDKLTDEDLKSWSYAWINEKGMPKIEAHLSSVDQFSISQSDIWGRGLLWPQDIDYTVLTTDGKPTSFKAEFKDGVHSVQHSMFGVYDDNPLFVPNVGTTGYGFFSIEGVDLNRGFDYLKSIRNNDAEKGSMLIIAYENLLQGKIDANVYLNNLLKYLPTEKNNLLFALALGHATYCQDYFMADTERFEADMWSITTANPEPQRRLQAFRAYFTYGESEECIDRIYNVWKGQQPPAGITLSESDYIQMSYILALRIPNKYDEIIAEQKSRITNQDRLAEYEFVSPSVSPDREVRDAMFSKLMDASNRRIEPWASSALSLLNHKSRQTVSVAYIRPALDILMEVKRTGDIFFPTNWLRALLAGHHSAEARKEIDQFFRDNPNYHPMLTNKIKQQSFHLYDPIYK